MASGRVIFAGITGAVVGVVLSALHFWRKPEVKQVVDERSKYEQCLQAFREGIDYVHRKYGTRPRGVVIEYEKTRGEFTASYEANSKFIYVSNEWLGDLSRRKYSCDSKIGGLKIDPIIDAALVGVEEAFHHYQLTHEAAFYESSRAVYPRGPDASYEDYRSHPIEKHAEDEVLKAFQDIQTGQWKLGVPGTCLNR